MASADEVQKLAALARIDISPEETEKFAKEFESILSYVGQIESLQVGSGTKVIPPHRNVFREDGAPHDSGLYTEKLVEQFPAREGDALSVKQIISHD